MLEYLLKYWEIFKIRKIKEWGTRKHWWRVFQRLICILKHNILHYNYRSTVTAVLCIWKKNCLLLIPFQPLETGVTQNTHSTDICWMRAGRKDWRKETPHHQSHVRLTRTAAMPERNAEGDAKGDEPRWGRSHKRTHRVVSSSWPP